MMGPERKALTMFRWSLWGVLEAHLKMHHPAGAKAGVCEDEMMFSQ